MLDWLRYRYQLSQLHKENRNLSRSHTKAYDQAAAEQKSKHELEKLVLCFVDETQMHYDRIGILQTNYLTSLALTYATPRSRIAGEPPF